MAAIDQQNTITGGSANGSGRQHINVAAPSAADLELAAARRRFTAAQELLMSFEPTAEQLDAAARALVKIAHKAISGRKTSADEEA